jgi:hypothetical protein
VQKLDIVKVFFYTVKNVLLVKDDVAQNAFTLKGTIAGSKRDFWATGINYQVSRNY